MLSKKFWISSLLLAIGGIFTLVGAYSHKLNFVGSTDQETGFYVQTVHIYYGKTKITKGDKIPIRFLGTQAEGGFLSNGIELNEAGQGQETLSIGKYPEIRAEAERNGVKFCSLYTSVSTILYDKYENPNYDRTQFDITLDDQHKKNCEVTPKLEMFKPKLKATGPKIVREYVLHGPAPTLEGYEKVHRAEQDVDPNLQQGGFEEVFTLFLNKGVLNVTEPSGPPENCKGTSAVEFKDMIYAQFKPNRFLNLLVACDE